MNNFSKSIVESTNLEVLLALAQLLMLVTVRTVRTFPQPPVQCSGNVFIS